MEPRKAAVVAGSSGKDALSKNMKILVPVKRVIDPSFKVRLKPDHSGLDMAYMKMVTNPYDEAALAAALQFKEQDAKTQVLTVSCGAEDSVETLRTTLAMGADEALFIEARQAMSTLVLARILKAVAVRENCDMVLIGRQGMGSDGNQAGPMLAMLLGWPFVPFAETLTIEGRRVSARCKTDHGFEMLETTLPVLASVEIGIAAPRYVSMPMLMKAKKKQIPSVTADELGIDMKMNVAVVQLREPPERRRGVMLPDSATLVERLRDMQII
ncbi:MAG: electron transfer flavoprotein subunit beta/FixA family protein [Burkholderiales bacterium]|jgi:electron transfer flavoprotein beta subunit|nr:electron transfer flavoprotein subunit beta/FixA family protein [Burkholderiales bacterium]